MPSKRFRMEAMSHLFTCIYLFAPFLSKMKGETFGGLLLLNSSPNYTYFISSDAHQGEDSKV